jgi:hypothetical protein
MHDPLTVVVFMGACAFLALLGLFVYGTGRWWD